MVPDIVTAKAAATIRKAVRRDVTGRDRPTGPARMRLLARHAAAATRRNINGYVVADIVRHGQARTYLDPCHHPRTAAARPQPADAPAPRDAPRTDRRGGTGDPRQRKRRRAVPARPGPAAGVEHGDAVPPLRQPRGPARTGGRPHLRRDRRRPGTGGDLAGRVRRIGHRDVRGAAQAPQRGPADRRARPRRPQRPAAPRARPGTPARRGILARVGGTGLHHPGPARSRLRYATEPGHRHPAPRGHRRVRPATPAGPGPVPRHGRRRRRAPGDPGERVRISGCG